MSAPQSQPTPPAPVIILPPPRKSRRGSENRQRVAEIRVRVLPQEKERLKAEASAAQMSVPGYLLSGRLGANAAPARRRSPVAVPVETKALAMAVVAFNRANSNLNQKARAANRLVLLGETTGNEALVEAARDLILAVEKLREEFAEPIAAIKAALWHDWQG